MESQLILHQDQSTLQPKETINYESDSSSSQPTLQNPIKDIPQPKPIGIGLHKSRPKSSKSKTVDSKIPPPNQDKIQTLTSNPNIKPKHPKYPHESLPHKKPNPPYEVKYMTDLENLKQKPYPAPLKNPLLISTLNQDPDSTSQHQPTKQLFTTEELEYLSLDAYIKEAKALLEEFGDHFNEAISRQFVYGLEDRSLRMAIGIVMTNQEWTLENVVKVLKSGMAFM